MEPKRSPVPSRPPSLPPIHHSSEAETKPGSPESAAQLFPTHREGPPKEDVFQSHQKEEFDRQLRNAFHERQKERKTRQIEHLVLGKGLGGAAEQSLKQGLYQPNKVLEPIKEKDAQMWEALDITAGFSERRKDDDSTTASSRGPPYLPAPSIVTVEKRGRLGENIPSPSHQNPNEDSTIDADAEKPLTDKLRMTVKPVSLLSEARREVEENLTTSEHELSRLCAPFTFDEVHETLREALAVLERGSLEEKVALPLYTRETPSYNLPERLKQKAAQEENPYLLTGAEEVLSFVRSNVIPLAYQALSATHATQWVIQYTVAFLRTMITQNEKEAQERVEMLARCVRLLGATESFSALLLSLESKAEEYDAFQILRDTAEMHLGSLIDEVEQALSAVLASKFPSRRSRLQMVERGVRAKIQRALVFINELDYNWSPNVKFHAEWKQVFLSSIFKRIHTVIEPLFGYCSLGFIDSCLYDPVPDSRLHGSRMASGTAPTFPRARSVEYDRTIESLSFAQIGMTVKGIASLVVGLQLCMGARYVVKQCSPAYDQQWGFHMNEDADGPSAVDAVKAVDHITKSVKQKTGPNAQVSRPPRSTVFLTQGGDDL